MKEITFLTDDELQDILNGCVDGVYPTTQVVAMANELIAVRAKIKTLESIVNNIIDFADEQVIDETVAIPVSILSDINLYYEEQLRAKHD